KAGNTGHDALGHVTLELLAAERSVRAGLVDAHERHLHGLAARLHVETDGIAQLHLRHESLLTPAAAGVSRMAGRNRSTSSTAATDVSASSKPGCRVSSFAVSAASAASVAPADPPVTATNDGSTPYASAFSRTQAIARLTSTRWSGNVARGLSR